MNINVFSYQTGTQNILHEDPTTINGVQKLLKHHGYQNINTKDIAEFQDQETWNEAEGTSDGKHVTLGSCDNADEKTKRVISKSATEEQAANRQMNTELATAEECCDGIKHAPDSECRDEETEGGGKKLRECEEKSGGEAENEFGDLVISNSYSEERRGFPKETCDCKIMNEAIFWRLKTIEENKARAIACSDPQTEIKTAKDSSYTIDSLKRKHSSTAEQTKRDENQYKRMACEIRAKQIVQEVFNNIGCYESFVRRADWADEPCSPSGDLVTIPVAYSFVDPYQKVYSLPGEGEGYSSFSIS